MSTCVGCASQGTQDNIANDLIEIGGPDDPEKKDPRGPGGGGAFGGGFNYPGAGGGSGAMKDPTLFTEPPPFQPGSSAYYPGVRCGYVLFSFVLKNYLQTKKCLIAV